MDAQSQLRSNSAKAPQRWLDIVNNDDQVRSEEEVVVIDFAGTVLMHTFDLY
jgi:hypothetical protein